MGVAKALCRAAGGARTLSAPAQRRLPPPPRRALSESAPAPAEVRPYAEMPGPQPFPVIGNVWRFLPLIGTWSGKDFLEIQWDLYNQYGKIVKLENMNEGRDMVFVFDPHDIEKVFRNESSWPKRNGFEALDYYRRNMNKEKFEGAHGLLTTNGEEWQDFRRRVQPHMLQPRVVAKYTTTIDTVSNELIQRLREIRDSNSTLPKDAINWFFRWAFESISVIALDVRMGCLRPQLEPESEQLRLIEAVHVLMESMYELDVKPHPWRYLSTPTWKRYVRAIDTFEGIASRYIDEAMVRLKNKVSAGEGDDLSVLEKLLVSNDNPRIAMTMATDMIFAGIDTTAYSIIVLLYYLAKNQEKQRKLFDDLCRVLPENNSPVTPENLSSMKYLRACIKESMRLKPTVIGQIRENTHDDLILGNYRIPKGVDMILLGAVSSRLEEFVPDPDRFVPERWLKGDELEVKGHPFATLPFSFGPRMCVGKRFAELEIEVLSAKILRNFHVEYPQEGKFETKFIHMMTSPASFTLNDRK